MKRRTSATQVELRIFAQLIKAESPLTVPELCDRTELRDGTIYPVIGKLISKDLLACDESVKPIQVSLMPSFEAWQYVLNELNHVQVFTGPLVLVNPYSPHTPVTPDTVPDS